MHFLILSGLLAVVSGARFAREPPVYKDELPPHPPEAPVTPVPIISYNFQPNNGDGNYAWSYETGNGIQAEESGSQKELGQDANGPILGNVAKGSYSYRDENGELVNIVYTADERGFLPIGDHLPTVPPPNEEIYRALYAAAEAQRMQGIPVSPAYTLFLRSARVHRQANKYYRH